MIVDDRRGEHEQAGAPGQASEGPELVVLRLCSEARPKLKREGAQPVDIAAGQLLDVSFFRFDF